VNHGHFLVNGKKTDVPAYHAKVGDAIEVRQRSRAVGAIVASLDAVESRGIPAWLELNREAFKGTVKAVPTKDEIALPVNEQMVVELYSR
jgi:small subunit ribosomal protein S4